MAIPAVSSSQSRGLSVSGVSLSGPGTPVPVPIGNRSPYHARHLHHNRAGSGDGGLMAMQIAHTPQGSRGGGEEYGLSSSMSRPIDVPAGSDGGDGGGGGMETHNFFSRTSPGGVGGGGGHDLIARSMGYTAPGAAGTSYPPRTGEGEALDTGRAEAYSYSAASFSMGGASGNFVASDFGYALQRPGLRYEPSHKQSPPASHSMSHVGPGSRHLARRRGSDVAPSRVQPGSSFGAYHQQSEGLGPRGHERGGRALSMDQSQGTALQYYSGGGGGSIGGGMGGGMGGQLSGGAARFGPQSSLYPMQQTSPSVSASTTGPPGYSPLARGTLLGPGPPSSAFRNNVPQAAVPWVRAGQGIGHSQPLSGGPRAHSTSPLFGRLVKSVCCASLWNGFDRYMIC